MKGKPWWLLVLVLGITLGISGCSGQAKSQTAKVSEQGGTSKAPQGIKELMQYKGADREQILLEGAKKEGLFVLYTQLNQEDADKIQGAFTKKYGIKTQIYRAQGEDVLQKTLTEAQADRIGADAFELDSTFMDILKKEKLLAPFWAPNLDKYPKESKDPDGFWQATRLTFDVLAYNTKMVSPAEVPHTYEDLLKPEYKGIMGIEQINTDWFATLVKYWGEQKNLNVRKGHTLLADLTVAGEFPITINSYNHKIEQLKKKGAPIDWIPLEPVVVIPSGVAVPEKAKHPNAGILFTDFLLSKEGQEILRDLNRVPASTEVQVDPPNLNKGFKFIPLSTDVSSEMEKWDKLSNDLIVQERKNNYGAK